MSFIWCDLETTGLDPQREEILSVGLLITDDNMREVARFERDVHVPLGYLAMREMSDYVREMHTKSGLLQRSADSMQHLGIVEQEACAFLTQHLGEPAEKITERPPMAGNSVNFDRGFLNRQCPGLIKHFNYRLLDVSTLKVLACATVPGARAWNDSRPDAAHTPLADLEGSISELAHWRAVLASVETAALEERIGVLSAGVRDVEQANANCQRRIVELERERDEAKLGEAAALSMLEPSRARAISLQHERELSLRQMQARLPWTIPYSAEFVSSAAIHRNLMHDVMHVMKSLGRIASLAEDFDHGRAPRLTVEQLAKELADLPICAMHMATTNPLGVIDLHSAVVKNSELRNEAPGALSP